MSLVVQQVWREQLAAVSRLQRDFGENTAFDHIIGEKLMNFAETAERHPRFAQELPAFVAALRDLFSPEVMKRGLLRLERKMEADEEDLDCLARPHSTEPLSSIRTGGQAARSKPPPLAGLRPAPAGRSIQVVGS